MCWTHTSCWGSGSFTEHRPWRSAPAVPGSVGPYVMLLDPWSQWHRSMPIPPPLRDIWAISEKFGTVMSKDATHSCTGLRVNTRFHLSGMNTHEGDGPVSWQTLASVSKRCQPAFQSGWASESPHQQDSASPGDLFNSAFPLGVQCQVTAVRCAFPRQRMMAFPHVLTATRISSLRKCLSESFASQSLIGLFVFSWLSFERNRCRTRDSKFAEIVGSHSDCCVCLGPDLFTVSICPDGHLVRSLRQCGGVNFNQKLPKHPQRGNDYTIITQALK